MTTTTTDAATTDSTTSPGTTDPTTEAPTTDSSTTESPTTTEATTDTTTAGDGLDCETYCQDYASACGDFSEYAGSNEVCLKQCSQWPEGSLKDVEGDTLGCRLYHARVAGMTDAAVHCPHAGPSGAGVCVDLAAPKCADYCGTYLKNCTGDLNVYKDEQDCLDRCAGWYPGTKDDTVGDTVGCRQYHAGAALADAPLHCPHASPGGGGICVVQ